MNGGIRFNRNEGPDPQEHPDGHAHDGAEETGEVHGAGHVRKAGMEISLGSGGDSPRGEGLKRRDFGNSLNNHCHCYVGWRYLI